MASSPDPERYVSASDLRAEVPFTAADFPVQDEAQFEKALRRALGSASVFVESWGGTKYEPTDVTENVWRPGHAPQTELPLPKRPVESVQSVSIDDEAVPADAYLVHRTYLGLKPESGRNEWPTDELVEVSWTYGFDAAPEPVRTAIIRLARNVLDQIETDGYEGDDEGGFRPPEAVKSECAAMVNGYAAPSYYSGAGVI